MGAAASLLVFTGLWRAFEWAMHGRNKDTARLIPLGLLYTVMGWCIVTDRFMPAIAWAALAVALLSMVGAFSTKNSANLPIWVIWAFICIDGLIILGLISGLLL